MSRRWLGETIPGQPAAASRPRPQQLRTTELSWVLEYGSSRPVRGHTTFNCDLTMLQEHRAICGGGGGNGLPNYKVVTNYGYGVAILSTCQCCLTRRKREKETWVKIFQPLQDKSFMVLDPPPRFIVLGVDKLMYHCCEPAATEAPLAAVPPVYCLISPILHFTRK